MTKDNQIWTLTRGDGPLVAAAIHDGHAIRADLKSNLALGDTERTREEDPYTGDWTAVAPNRVIGTHSRFEVDLNRPRDKAVYLRPEDAWGLKVWKEVPSETDIAGSLARYDAFYGGMHDLFQELTNRYGCFFVYDLHTYNHRRSGPDQPAADPEKNPEVNIGTGTMNREYWAPLVDRLIEQLQRVDFLGRRLDVRENKKFRGGQLSRWTHENFPGFGCSVAIEFKKVFMDEWTGELDETHHKAIHDALQSTVPVVEDALARLGNS